jgi:hypothetical protein
MPARRKRVGKPMRAAKAAAEKLASLSLDMEVPLNEALDAVHALRLIGHGLREFVDEYEGRAVASTAWDACQRLEALQKMWRDLCEITVRARERT